MLPADFIQNAAAEMSARRLQNLLPYATIAYLGDADSQAVMAGLVRAADCAPQKTLAGGRDVQGGASLVCARFLERHGGVPEGFLGWGGEDNAWMHKASLLARCGVTTRPGQKLFHLFHAPEAPGSGAGQSPTLTTAKTSHCSGGCALHATRRASCGDFRPRAARSSRGRALS